MPNFGQLTNYNTNYVDLLNLQRERQKDGGRQAESVECSVNIQQDSRVASNVSENCDKSSGRRSKENVAAFS